MRWFKHMVDSADDERLAELIGFGGMEAYGFWWRLLEIIALQMGKNDMKCSVTYPLSQWSRLLYCHHNKVGKYLAELERIGLIEVDYPSITSPLPPPLPSGYPPVTPPSKGGVTVKYAQGKIRVTIPNLLKYRDEYSRKSGQTPDKLRSKKQIQIQKEKENIKPPSTPPKGEELVLPDYIDQETWAAFTEMRQKIKKPMTDKAKKMMLKKLESYHLQNLPVNEMIEQSVMSSWQDIYPIKDAGGTQQKLSTSSQNSLLGYYRGT